MKFTLTIELGNDAMRSYQDLRDALKQVGAKLGSRQHCVKGTPSDGDGSKVMDENGNSVGEWKIGHEQTTPAEQDAEYINMVNCDDCGEENQAGNPCACEREKLATLKRYSPDPELFGGSEEGRCVHCGEQRLAGHAFRTNECIKQ